MTEVKSRQKRAVQVFLVLLFSLVLSWLSLGCADESSSDSEVEAIRGVNDEGETGNDGVVALTPLDNTLALPASSTATTTK